MSSPAGAAAAPRLRADARRNQDRLLAAARDVFAERGPGAPLEAIARRAGVGIGTLYRRFPDRRALQRAVALDTWGRMAHEARRARAEAPDAFRALARYMHRGLALRVGVVLPALSTELAPGDEALRRAADDSAAAVQELIDASLADRSLRPDVAFGDVGLVLIRLSRPLPAPLPRSVDDQLAHRHLDLLLDGLRADGRRTEPLPGPALELADLRALGATAAPQARPATAEDG